MVLLDKISKFLNQTMILLAGIILVGMMLLTCANIFMRIFWVPISGTIELIGFFGAIVAAFPLGYTLMKRGYISVDVLYNTFPAKVRLILNSLNNIICMVFFAVAARQIAQWATTIWKTGEVTETLRIIYYPFTYAVALGCAILSLVFLIDFLKTLLPVRKDKQ